MQTTEELKDVHAHFLLYYSPDIPKMQEAWKAKEKEKAKETRRFVHLSSIWTYVLAYVHIDGSFDTVSHSFCIEIEFTQLIFQYSLMPYKNKADMSI